MITQQELKAKNHNAGRHFFSPDTMRFFKSRLITGGHEIKTTKGSMYLFCYSNKEPEHQNKIALMLEDGTVTVQKMLWNSSGVMADSYMKQLTENTENIPHWLAWFAWRIIAKYQIQGVCDFMYICNVTAKESNTGDGQGNFWVGNPEVESFAKIAERLSFSYGCNIPEGKEQSIINDLEMSQLD